MPDYYPSDDSGFFLSLLAMPFVWGKQKLRSYRSLSWPSTNGIIETGEVFWGGTFAHKLELRVRNGQTRLCLLC